MKSTTQRLFATLSIAVALASTASAQVVLYHLPGDGSGDEHGDSVAPAGDINADGFPDVIVGAPYDDNTGFDTGMARVYSGKTGAVLYTFNGSAVGDYIGWSVAGGGDLNNDGRADVVVGGWGASSGAGKVVAYSGLTGAVLWTWTGISAPDRLGYSVDIAGDVDADGYDDVVAGAPLWSSYTGRVYVFSGRTGATLRMFDGDAAGDFFGWSVAGAGNVNGDAYDDLIAGAPYDDDNGTDCGMARALSGAPILSPTLHTWYGDSAGDEFGWSVDGAGDVSGDGRGDLIVGARYDSNTFSGAGMARVFNGVTWATMFSVDGDMIGANLGSSVAGAGDVNGDGLADVVAGAPYGSPPLGEGFARVYAGPAGVVLHTVTGWFSSAEAGSSVNTAGDVNLDGKSDFIVGGRGDGGNGSLSGHARLHLAACPESVNYCTPKVNSLGCTPAISSTGAASLSVGDNFILRASNVRNQKPGLGLWSPTVAATPFGGGTLCVAAPITRTPGASSGGTPSPANDCTGSYSFHFSQAYMISKGLVAGTTLHGQFWSRDPGFAPPANIGLTDARTWQVCP